MSLSAQAKQLILEHSSALKSHATKPTRASASALLEQWQELVLQLLAGSARTPAEPGSKRGPQRALFTVDFRSTGRLGIMDYDGLAAWLNWKRSTLQVKVSNGRGKLELVRPNPDMDDNDDCLTISKITGPVPDDIQLWQPRPPRRSATNKLIR